MAYEPKTWACGDTITADDLNHIEQGIAEAGGAPFVVNFTDESGSWVADKTWNDAKQAIENGIPVIGMVKKSGTPFTEYYTMPLLHKMNVMTGNFISISYANNKMFYYRIDWFENGYIDYNSGSYTLA